MTRFRTVTLRELAAIVDDAARRFGEDTPVAFVCSYGDYNNTQQALPFGRSDVELVRLEESAYSSSGWAIQQGEGDECPECLAEVREGATVCPECGHTWTEEEGDEKFPEVAVFQW